MSKGAQIIALFIVVLFLGAIGFGLYFLDLAGSSSYWSPPTENPPKESEGFLIPNTAWISPESLPQD